jgi:hypothetical protein
MLSAMENDMPKQKTKEEADREREIAELKKAVERAEGRGQFDTSYHTTLARLTGKETRETKEQLNG